MALDVVITPGTPAASEPVFLIKVPRPNKAPVYYLTLAIWEYDIEKAQAQQSEDHIQGCTDIAAEFDEVIPKLEAIVRSAGGAGGGGDHTTHFP
jgi:hypothetical protein